MQETVSTHEWSRLFTKEKGYFQCHSANIVMECHIFFVHVLNCRIE